MKFLSIVLPLSGALLAAASPVATNSTAADTPTSTEPAPSAIPTDVLDDGPLPDSLPTANVTRIISIAPDVYPIGISNETHYFLYLVNATTYFAAHPDGSVEKRSPGWTWWQPYPGEPAWKKTKRDANASPGWIWRHPYPGEPAW